MNDEMCAKEELSKVEKKLKRKGRGDNTENHDDGENFTNEGNLLYSNYYEQGNDDEEGDEKDDYEHDDAPYNLGNPVSRNVRTDPVLNEEDVYHRTFNNGYEYVEDFSNPNDNARGGMYEMSVHSGEAGNNDGMNIDSNLNESLMKLFSMNCNMQEEKEQHRDINSFNKILKKNSNEDLSDAATICGENTNAQTGLGQVPTNELIHEDKQSHCDEMSSGDFVKGYNEPSNAYQEEGNNGVTHFVEHRSAYEGGSGHFEGPLKEKKKHPPKRTMGGAPSCVEYDSGDGNGETIYCVNNENGSCGSNASMEGTELIVNEDEQYFSSDVAKRILNNMDLMYTLNRETHSGATDEEGDKFEMGLLNKYNSVNYMNNIIQDLSELRGENDRLVDRNMGINFGVNMEGVAEGSEINNNHDENYKKVISADMNRISDSHSMLMPSGGKVKTLANKRGKKKQTMLTKKKEKTVMRHNEEEGDYSNRMYIMHENNSRNVSLNSNKVNPGEDPMQNGNQLSGPSTSNEANLQKHVESMMKGNSSMNNYDYCSYGVNSTGNPFELMKSQQKYSSRTGEHKYQMGHHNSSNSSNPAYLISGGKIGKSKTRSNGSNNTYQNDEYPGKESNFGMVKKTNKGRENSSDEFSINNTIANLFGLPQSNNKKKHNAKKGAKLVNINYGGRAVSHNQGSNNYHGMYTKEGVDMREANETVQYNCEENYSKEVPPKVNYRSIFSSRIRNVKGEKYSYLKKSKERSNPSNVSSGAHAKTNGEDGESYQNKPNESVNFEMMDSLKYQGGKSDKEESVNSGNIKGENNFEEYGERNAMDYLDQQHHHHGQENSLREFHQSGQSRQSHQVDVLRNLPPEAFQNGSTIDDAPIRYVHKRYNRNSEGEMEQFYQVEEDENSHVANYEQYPNGDEQKDEQNYFNQWNKHFISALNDVNIKMKQASNKRDYLNSGSSSPPTKDISNVENEMDNFTKNKNNFYLNNYEEISKALFNIKNNPQIDDLTKKRLLSTIENSFFADKNGSMPLLHGEGDGVQNEMQQVDYVDELAAQQEVVKDRSKSGSRNEAKVGTRKNIKSLPKSGTRIVQKSDHYERLGHFNMGENFKRSKKNEFKVQHTSYGIDEMRNGNSNQYFDTSSTLQQMMSTQQEHNLGGNPGYSYDESKARLYQINGKEDTKNVRTKERKKKRSKKSMNITDQRAREDEALQLGGEHINEKYETYEGTRNGMSGVDNESAVSSSKNEGNYVDEMSSNNISSVTHNSLVQQGLAKGPLGGRTVKRGKRPKNYEVEKNGHDELKKVATRKGEMTKEMEKYGKEVMESVDDRIFLYSNVGRGSSLGSGYTAGGETNGTGEEFLNGKFHPEGKQSAQYVSVKDEPHARVEENNCVYPRKRTDTEEEDLSLVSVRNEYEEVGEMSSTMNRYKSDDIFIKKYDLTNDEKKQKMYLADIMRSNELKQVNDNYFKLNSNFPSNLLSTSTSSSYSNDNLKGSTNNYSFNELSSNTLTSKFHLDESMPSNMNMSSQMCRNNYSSYEKKKKKTDKRNLGNLYNNTPTTYATCMNDSSSTTIKLVDHDVSNDEKMNQKSKNHIMSVNGQNDAEGVNALQNAAVNLEYLTKEVIKGNKNIINLNKKMGDNKVHGEKSDLLVVGEGTPLSDALSSNPNFPNGFVVHGQDDHSENHTNHASNANNNSSGNDNDHVEGPAKEYADRVNEKEHATASNSAQFDERIRYKNKNHTENGKYLSFLKKEISSSHSDHKGADVAHQIRHNMLHPNGVKSENEFLLNRTNSLNLSLGGLSQGMGDYDNMEDENSGVNSNRNHIYDGMVRVKDEEMCNSNFSDQITMSEGFGQELISGGMAPTGKEEQLEGEAANGAISETVSGTVGGSATERTISFPSDAPNELSNPTGSSTKNDIDISVCTLPNCPTHNPQGYTKNVSRKGDGQGEGGMMKEENDELKRIPGVYYDKNSQRWFGEHKINGVKCAQSFAVKKHGCEEAKRLAIEWKKARIRGEVWDRFINKKKKNTTNPNCVNKTAKTSRPSVEELRIKYLSMSKNMPKVRGVWFNSTPQRMGWVGQAYKKCKRIERIFSVNKYGFEGARKLAIAFRNSQKPSNDDSDEDSWCKNDKMTIETGEDNLNNYEYKNEYSGSNELPIKNNSSSSSSNEINPIKIETKDTRINLCRDAILFILHDLETILELNIPMLHKNVNIYKICIKHHLNYLTLIKSEEQIIPYLNIFGDYIQRCILPTDLPYAELYVLIDSLIHNDILPSFDHKENFCEYSMAEDPGIITPSMLL
ncbi:Transcription factor with AP2 domain(S) [Plasmodium coatneyi]|uniref:Transcription factor with AP2 domain(S) n=1 Tax=Plasmodium coatneyi TaxID=208452 RepID=A0A1B1E7E6_9APIC|nr:Transcription factor with AP2 domain(S) [Plasmodium coatneyi]ANQ10946.1 Transcription factor with AP2 domain(S) [Plasmodium coatneyi]